MVAQLEQDLGVKLLDRSKRPFVLTPEGEFYYEGCRDLVQQLSALEEEVRTLRGEVEGRVAVASIYSVGLSHLSACVQRFLGRYPKANIRVEYQHPRRVVELVEGGQVDLGLMSYPRASRTVSVIQWREEPMVVVCAPGHCLAGHERVLLAELNGLDMVGFENDLMIRRETDRVLAAHNVRVQVVMEFDNIEILKRAVEIRAGFGLLPEPTVTREVQIGSLVAIPLDDVELTRPLGILHRRGVNPGATAQRFIHFLREHAHRVPEECAAVDPLCECGPDESAEGVADGVAEGVAERVAERGTDGGPVAVGVDE
jgi:DNA-binding transcriptional LysR family regulator